MVEFGLTPDQIHDKIDMFINEDANHIEGATVLFRAAARGRIDIVRLLINESGDVNEYQEEGPYKNKMALYVAAEAGHADIVQLLIDQGADFYTVGTVHITEKNADAVNLINAKRDLFEKTMAIIADKVMLRMQSARTPVDIMKHTSIEVFNIKIICNHMRFSWKKLIKIDKDFDEIASRIAETDLSIKAIERVFDSMVPMTRSGPAILHSANMKKETKMDDDGVGCSSSDLNTRKAKLN